MRRRPCRSRLVIKNAAISATLLGLALCSRNAAATPASFDLRELAKQPALVARIEHYRAVGDITAAAAALESSFRASGTTSDSNILLAAAAVTWTDAGDPERATALWSELDHVRCQQGSHPCTLLFEMAAQYAVPAALAAFEYTRATTLCKALVAITPTQRAHILGLCAPLLVSDVPALSAALNTLDAARASAAISSELYRSISFTLCRTSFGSASEISVRSRVSTILENLSQGTDVTALHAAFALARNDHNARRYRQVITVYRSLPPAQRQAPEVTREVADAAITLGDAAATAVVDSTVHDTAKLASWSLTLGHLEVVMPQTITQITRAYDDLEGVAQTAAELRRAKMLLDLARNIRPFTARCPPNNLSPSPSGLPNDCVVRHIGVGAQAIREAFARCDTAFRTRDHRFPNVSAEVLLSASWVFTCDVAQQHLDLVTPMLSVAYHP